MPDTRRPSNGSAPTRIRIVAAALSSARAAAARLAADLRMAWPGCDVVLHGVEIRGGGSDAGAIAASLRGELRAGSADAAVHLLRGLPYEPATDLRIVAVPLRDDPRDALIVRSGKVLQYVPGGARLGTLELRQAAQLRRRRSDLRAVELADDAVEALARLDAGDLDGLVVPAADMARLDLLDRVTEYFDTDVMIPGPGQGAIGIEAPVGASRVAAWFAPVHDPDSAYAVAGERTCAARLGAVPRSPVGIYALTDGQTMFIHGIVATPDGTRAARLRWSGPTREAEEVGETLAELLASVGARDILAGGPLPPSIRYAERRKDLIEGWEDQSPGA